MTTGIFETTGNSHHPKHKWNNIQQLQSPAEKFWRNREIQHKSKKMIKWWRQYPQHRKYVMAAGNVVTLLNTIWENVKWQSSAVITRALLTLMADAEGTTRRMERNKPFPATKPKPLKQSTPMHFMSKIIQTDLITIQQDYWLTQELHTT